MKALRVLASLGLAIAAFAAVSYGSNDVSMLEASEAQVVQAGQVSIAPVPILRTPDCFRNVSNCLRCTANNMSCTQAGRIDRCRRTAPPTLCAILINPPFCGLKVIWSGPNCSGIAAISLNVRCRTFICA